MAMMRCVRSSCNSWRTLPGCRSSSRQAASASVSPKRRSAALSRTAPPSELPCRSSNLTTTGRSKISGNSKHSVVVCSFKRKPPIGRKPYRHRLCTMKEAFRVLNSGIIQARDRLLKRPIFGSFSGFDVSQILRALGKNFSAQRAPNRLQSTHFVSGFQRPSGKRSILPDTLFARQEGTNSRDHR